MKLLSLNKNIFLLFFLIFLATQANSEESVDIWKKTKDAEQSLKKITNKKIDGINSEKINLNNFKSQSIKIDNNISEITKETKLYGLFDPVENNFNLEMWSRSDSNDIKEIFDRINKLELSSTAEKLFLNTIMTFSFPPQNITEENFLNLKINWLIENRKDNLLEEFLNKNKNFSNNKKIIQYLVDRNIANAKLKEGCEKVNFLNKEIKDAYLEKFKIYCLIFNDKKNQAQLLYEILKEQGLSDKFFDDKINYLLGITNKTNANINDKSLLNFYLSSITTQDFKYEPNKKTKKVIWEYLNSANLIQIKDINNKEKILELENAANQNSLDKKKIFEIYKKIPFDLITLINAENVYQTYDRYESRALIYQKFLLSDNIEKKIKLLLLLKDLFKKDKILNVYAQFLSDQLEQIGSENIPDSFQEIVSRNIISEVEYKLGRIKYDDKVLHRSRVIRYYTELDTPKQKVQKDLNNIYKKIKRNKKYFFSAKDLILIEALAIDGFKVPKDINYGETAKKYNIPQNLLNFVENQEIGFLALKFVEIIGEDEISNLDPETVYFITNILNRAKLFKLRNQILISSLPLRS